MKNKILGTIGILWGGAIVGRWLLGSPQISNSPSYQSGQIVGLVWGFLMLGVGSYYVFKKNRPKD